MHIVQVSYTSMGEPPDYSLYGQRLNTFNDWPATCAVYIKDLAEVGFVYTGEIDLVYCFKCGIKESNWQDDDDPMARHCEANPYCPYVLEQQKKTGSDDKEEVKSLKSLEQYERESFIYDWIPGKGVVQRSFDEDNDGLTGVKTNTSVLMSNQTNTTNDDQPIVNLRLVNEDMRFESERYKSFAFCSPNKHWPSPEKLSSAGFYYIDDKVGMKCFCCGAVVEGWESAEQCPFKKHRSLTPNCAFTLGTFCGNIPCGQEDVCNDMPLLINNIQPPVKKVEFPNYTIIDREYLKEDDDLSSPNTAHVEQENAFDCSLNCQHNNTTTGIVPQSPMYTVKANRERVVNGYTNYPNDDGFNERPREFIETKIPDNNNRLLCIGIPSPVHSIPQHYQLQRSPVENAQMRLNPNVGLSKEFTDESKRLKTFFTWPRESPMQPLELARAGFVYEGKGDRVRCHNCNVYFFGWTHNDSPWIEHQKASPNCPLAQTYQPAQKNNIYNRQHVQQQQHIHHHHQHHHQQQQQQRQRQQQISPRFFYNEPRFPIMESRYHHLMVDSRYPLQPQTSSLSNQYSQQDLSLSSINGVSPYNTNFKERQRVFDAARNNFPMKTSSNLRLSSPHNNQNHDVRKPVMEMSNIGYQRPCYVERRPISERNESLESNNSLTEMMKNLRFEHSARNQPGRGGGMTIPHPTMYNHDSPVIEEKYTNENKKSPGIGPETPSSPYQGKFSPGQVRIIHQENTIRAEQFAKNNGYFTPKKDDIDRNCKVCMENDVAVTFVPCGHLVVCESCALGLKECPICRKLITNTVRTFF